MYASVLLFAVCVFSSFQCLNGDLDVKFQHQEIKGIANSIILSAVAIRARAVTYLQKYVSEETSRLISILVSFKSLVDYKQKNKPSCITPDIREIYNITSTDAISSQMKECLPCIGNNVNSILLDLMSDVFDQLHTVDLRLTNILDDVDKDIEIVLANWCVPGSFYEFCIEVDQAMSRDLTSVLLCLVRNIDSVSYKVEASIQSIGECSK